MQLFKISEMLGQQILKIHVGRVLGPRWAACSLRSALAVWRAYPALYKYFSFLSFGLFLIRSRHSRYLHFYNMAFVFAVGCPSRHQPSLRRKNWATCLPHKGGGIRSSVLPKNTISVQPRNALTSLGTETFGGIYPFQLHHSLTLQHHYIITILFK